MWGFCRVADKHHYAADPDPVFHLHVNEDPDPDPAPHQSDGNLPPLALMRIRIQLFTLFADPEPASKKAIRIRSESANLVLLLAL
jgi:hypothetical protein